MVARRDCDKAPFEMQCALSRHKTHASKQLRRLRSHASPIARDAQQTAKRTRRWLTERRAQRRREPSQRFSERYLARERSAHVALETQREKKSWKIFSASAVSCPLRERSGSLFGA
jgi:hypothetical protein